MPMMKSALIVIALVAVGLSGISPAFAQALISPQKYNAIPSPILPVVPREVLGSSPAGPVTNDMANALYDHCMSKIPSRFTAESQKYYCGCASAATQGNFTAGELAEMQDPKKRIIGNKIFERYIREVIYTCLDEPVTEVEYTTCTQNRNTDWRIRYPVPYCKCVSSEVSDHFKKLGETELVIAWGTYAKRKADPVDALWESTDFQNARSEARESCVGSYIDKEVNKVVK
ncbi:MAG: hypothetical protein WC043_04615 [Pseudobdellovibrionaceae bacterium]